MKKPLSVLAAVAAGALLVPGAAQAAPKPSAEVLGTVVTSADGKTATVRARYTCTAPSHLWVSAKQMADGERDPRFHPEAEGTSRIADSYLQSHPQTLDCDGKSHVQSFTIDQTEQAMGPTGPVFDGEGKPVLVGKGALVKGQAWVQFCLIGSDGSFVYPQRWTQVR